MDPEEERLTKLANYIEHGDSDTTHPLAPTGDPQTLEKPADCLEHRGDLDAEGIVDLVDRSHTDAPASPATSETGQDEAGLQVGGYDVDAINRGYGLVLWGGRAVVVKERPDGPIEDRIRVLTIEAFCHWFSNQFTEARGGDGKVRRVPWGKAWLADYNRRQFEGIEFVPSPDGAAATPGYLNLWRGFSVEPSEEGSWSIFRDHLLVNVCQEDPRLFEWVLAWFAHIVQRPRERAGTALVLRGRMGTGKTKVGEVFGSLFATHYFQVDDPRYIVGNFNAHMASCLLLQAEEAVWAGDKHAEGRLKGLVTSEHQMIEAKGIDPIRIRNFVRLMMTSNEGWVVPAGPDERRFCVLDVNPRCAQNHEYFREMQAQLDDGGRERLLYDLLRFDLSKINLRSIPRTQALLEQKIRSLDPLDGWWLSRLTDGTSAHGRDDWDLVTTDALYADYIKTADEQGVRRKRDRSSWGYRLKQIVPGIKKKRLRIEEEARRVWSYRLPPLCECREAFEAMLGQRIDWPPEPNGGEVEPEGPAMDDIVPA